MGKIRRAGGLAILILTASAAPGQFQRLKDPKGAEDHPLVARFPGAVIRAYQVREYDEFELPLGRTERVQGGFELSRTRRLEGKITSIQYGISPGSSSLLVYRHYAEALRSGGFVDLFSCSRAECGPNWVGTHFDYENHDLRGENQRLRVARLQRDEGDVYVSLYVVEHTFWNSLKGTVLARLDVVETRAVEEGRVDTGALASELNASGHVALYGIQFDTAGARIREQSKATLDEIALLLRRDPTLELYVVGHTDNVGELDFTLELSLRRAEAVVEMLTSQAYGIAPGRLHPHGLGSLAPVASNDTESGREKNRRVVLVRAN